MKKNYIVAVCAVILAVLLLCSGCTDALQNLDNPEIRRNTEAMLDALIADDFEAAYSLVDQLCTKEEFKPTFLQMREPLRDSGTYDLRLLSIHTNATRSDGQTITAVSSVYEMTSNGEKMIISVQIDDQVGLRAFYLTPYELTDYHSTGTLGKMNGATGMQWVILLLNVIVLGFTVFTVADCCRHDLKQKALWILLVILGFATFGATVSATGVRVNVNVGWIMGYSALIRYGSGTVTLRLMVPVGVIVYFVKRHSLLRQSAPAAVPCEAAPLIPEEAIVTDQPACQLPVDSQATDTE